MICTRAGAIKSLINGEETGIHAGTLWRYAYYARGSCNYTGAYHLLIYEPKDALNGALRKYISDATARRNGSQRGP